MPSASTIILGRELAGS